MCRCLGGCMLYRRVVQVAKQLYFTNLLAILLDQFNQLIYIYLYLLGILFS